MRKEKHECCVLCWEQLINIIAVAQIFLNYIQDSLKLPGGNSDANPKGNHFLRARETMEMKFQQ